MLRDVTPFRGLTVEQARDYQKQRLAAKRWAVETGGFTIAGARIPTDEQSQGKIGNGYNLAARRIANNDDTPFSWKGADGWVSLTPQQVAGMATVIGGFVEACFDRERALSAQIDAATTVEAVAAVDITAGWPADHSG